MTPCGSLSLLVALFGSMWLPVVEIPGEAYRALESRPREACRKHSRVAPYRNGAPPPSEKDGAETAPVRLSDGAGAPTPPNLLRGGQEKLPCPIIRNKKKNLPSADNQLPFSFP